MSSSDPAGTRELAATLAMRGVTLVDAPVSGGTKGAEAASLTIMIGSDDKAAVERIRPILGAMGQRLFETGGSGTGHAMKALNNFIAGTNFLAAAEALVVGRRFGLDPALMIDIINQSTGRNFSTENLFRQQVLSRKFGSGFQLGLLAKDVKIAADLADDLQAHAPVAQLSRDLLARAQGSLRRHRRSFRRDPVLGDAQRRDGRRGAQEIIRYSGCHHQAERHHLARDAGR